MNDWNRAMTDHPRQTTCSVVGAGPAGVILSLLLSRQGVPVTLLEAHKDFDRDFRGDTIHPSTLELLDELGLAEPLHSCRIANRPACPSSPLPGGSNSPTSAGFGRASLTS